MIVEKGGLSYGRQYSTGPPKPAVGGWVLAWAKGLSHAPELLQVDLN
jgi:hypothetical protein